MESLIEKLIIGAVGGIAAYWLAHMKFLNQKWWDKKYDLYIEAFDILKKIERSLATFEWGVQNDQYISNNDQMQKALLDYEDGISQLHGLQSKMMLIGLKQAHMKILNLIVSLRMIHPDDLISGTNEDGDEILTFIKKTKGLTGGCSGELALTGKIELSTGSNIIHKIQNIIRIR